MYECLLYLLVEDENKLYHFCNSNLIVWKELCILCLISVFFTYQKINSSTRENSNKTIKTVRSLTILYFIKREYVPSNNVQRYATFTTERGRFVEIPLIYQENYKWNNILWNYVIVHV